MYFLVDFENVRSGGLRGVDYLEESDYLTIFFSNAAHSCENRYLEDKEHVSDYSVDREYGLKEKNSYLHNNAD